MKYSLGQYLAEIRQEKGWSQRDLAKKAGCSYTQIARIENDEIESPGLQLLLSISDAVNTPIEKLILAFKGENPNEIVKMEDDAQLIKDAMQEALEIVLGKKRKGG